MMVCTINGYPREYEEQKIMHMVRYHGQIVVVDHVPAEVCSVCGDVLLKPDIVKRIEKLLKQAVCPASAVPLYEFA